MTMTKDRKWLNATKTEDIPADLAALTVSEKYVIPLEELRETQLAVLKSRVETLAECIPVVCKLAAEQSIDQIRTVADVAPLLLRNATYKSYPASVIENGRFDQLTRWLDKLTTHDLSDIDTSDCHSIDDWIDRIGQQSEIRIIHSSGTSGKLSFLPRSNREIRLSAEAFQHVGEGFGSEADAGAISDFADMPLVWPSFRRGATDASRLQDGLVKYVYGGNEGMIVPLDEGRISADALSLVGRLQKGTIGASELRAKIRPEVLARFESLKAAQADAAGRLHRFISEKLFALKGRKVVFVGSIGMFYDSALEGERQGISGIFAPGSVIIAGGGLKGRSLPPDYMEVIQRFLGIKVHGIYGMTECIALSRDCPEGNFHVQPWIVPFLLNPTTGEQFPRSATHKGHLGLFDLLPGTYWGGYLTGDEVTLSWGDIEPCRCGRVGPYVHPAIRRYSEQEGGDDKITCAGTPEAHNRAIEFITNIE